MTTHTDFVNASLALDFSGDTILFYKKMEKSYRQQRTVYSLMAVSAGVMFFIFLSALKHPALGVAVGVANLLMGAFMYRQLSLMIQLTAKMRRLWEGQFDTNEKEFQKEMEGIIDGPRPNNPGIAKTGE